MLSHDVFFTLRDSSQPAIDALLAACSSKLRDHEGVLFFSVGGLEPGLDRPVNDQAFHVALHVTFVDRAAHDRYQEAAEHHPDLGEARDYLPVHPLLPEQRVTRCATAEILFAAAATKNAELARSGLQRSLENAALGAPLSRAPGVPCGIPLAGDRSDVDATALPGWPDECWFSVVCSFTSCHPSGGQ